MCKFSRYIWFGKEKPYSPRSGLPVAKYPPANPDRGMQLQWRVRFKENISQRRQRWIPKRLRQKTEFYLTQKNVSYNNLVSQRLSDKKIKVIKMQKNCLVLNNIGLPVKGKLLRSNSVLVFIVSASTIMQQYNLESCKDLWIAFYIM